MNEKNEWEIAYWKRISYCAESTKQMEEKLNFQVPAEGLQLVILLKTVAFIAGKKNPAIQKNFIRFSIEIKLKKYFRGEIASKI